MLDPKALQQLVEQQIKQDVDQAIRQLMTEAWLKKIESDSVRFIQDRIVAKFANSEAMPELVEAVKSSVKELFQTGQIPGLGQYVDYDYIKQAVNDSSQAVIQTAINELSLDPQWLEKIEKLVNQQAAHRVAAGLSSVDLGSIVRSSVDSAVNSLKVQIFHGISSTAEAVELTVMDQHVVVENNFTARSISAVDSITVKDLVVKGSVNVDNRAWQTLADSISQRTLEQLNDEWKSTLVDQVKQSIKQQGIDFSDISVGGVPLVKQGKLSSSVTESSLKSVGALQSLTVSGTANLNETLAVHKKRVGINTEEPDMALSLWDEEVAISVGKIKNQTGYIGTTRKQGIAIGVNRTAAVEIDENGLTAVKKIQVGQHRISHGTEVPNYSGTRGDIVFNANASVDDSVFAWQCLGGFKWKVIRAVQ